MAAELDGLTVANREAWALYTETLSRFAVETHTVGVALEAALDGCPADERIETMQRLAIIYDHLNPQERPRGA